MKAANIILLAILCTFLILTNNNCGKKGVVKVDQDTTPPTVSITTPTDRSSVSGVVLIVVDATDDVGVVTVDLYIDGELTISDKNTPWEYTHSRNRY